MLGGGRNEYGGRSGEAEVDLPVEIAFLARHGIAPAELAAAARRAARLGVPPVREIIASGLIEEAAFYRALAAELGLPFHDGELAFRPGGRHGAILREGMAVVIAAMGQERFRFAIAPQGRMLQRLLESRPPGREDVVVMTPRAFAASLRAANGPALARHVAGLDRAGLARESARTGSGRGQKLVVGAGSLTTAVCGALSPLETFFMLALLLGPVFFGLIYLRVAAAAERPLVAFWRPQRWRIDDSRLPVYTVLVPLYREERVLPQLLRALTAFDYPPAKLDIKLLVEADDAGMRAALAGLALPPQLSVVIVPPGEPRTKPRALNLGLLEARGALLVVYDAEDIPDPQQLRLAAARFLRAPANLVCLQARLVIDHASEGLLPALFALEYAGLFEVLNPGLLRCHLPIMLGGTSNHFRISALREVGGWDAWNVTEDADLSLRLVRAGYRIDDLPSSTREEAPLTLSAWLAQRSRWIKGYMQTLVTHLRSPLALLREAGLPATLVFLSLALGTVVTALGYPIFAVATALAYWNGLLLAPPHALAGVTSTLALTIWIMGAIALFAPPALGALRLRAPRLLLLLPLLPLYYVLVSVAAWRAFYEYWANRFAWNKTAHGLARRRGPIDAAATPPRPPPAAARY